MICTCLFIAALLAAAEGAPVTARVELDAAEIPFHHVAHYRVTAEGPTETELTVEPWGDALPGLSVEAGDPSETLLSDGRKQFVQEFTLTPSVVQQYALPEVRILANGVEAVALPSQELVIRDLTAEERAEASVAADLLTLADLDPSNSQTWRDVLMVLLAFTAATAAGLAVIRYIQRRPAFRVVLSPREIVDAGLAALEQDLQSGAITCDAFYVCLAQLLRAYLCSGFDPAVVGQTTPEFLETTLATLPLPAAHAGAVRDLLREFDGVKFAQQAPDREAQGRSLRAVRNLVEALEREVANRSSQAFQGAA